MIEFLCPSGHRIHCAANQVGRAAKCPKCGIKFRVPDPSLVGGVASGPAGPDASAHLASTVENAAKSAETTTNEEPQIEFLCPNGHRLHGPASLQGNPGECPQCASRFRIPTYDVVPDEEKTESGLGVGRADGSSDSSTSLAQIDQITEFAEEGAEWADIPRPIPVETTELTVAGHPMGHLFAKLWRERPSETAIALHLSDGETLVPNYFAESLSQESHGVFAVKEPGKTYTLTVVAWDSVVRVLVRGVSRLPDEM